MKFPLPLELRIRSNEFIIMKSRPMLLACHSLRDQPAEVLDSLIWSDCPVAQAVQHLWPLGNWLLLALDAGHQAGGQ